MGLAQKVGKASWQQVRRGGSGGLGQRSFLEAKLGERPLGAICRGCTGDVQWPRGIACFERAGWGGRATGWLRLVDRDWRGLSACGDDEDGQVQRWHVG